MAQAVLGAIGQSAEAGKPASGYCLGVPKTPIPLCTAHRECKAVGVHEDDRSHELEALLLAVRGCRVCEPHLPLGPRPLVQMGRAARILIVGQAPGAQAHASGIPWADRSGDRLRDWMGIDIQPFYDPDRIALVPIGLCYPGRGASGDLPPRRECAPLWHGRLLAQLPQPRLTLLVGRHAQQYRLAASFTSVTSTVRDWRLHAPRVMPLPHPSTRNIAWFKANPWFERELVPALRQSVRQVLGG